MGNTYSQVSIHAVFAVKNRENFITHEWRDNLHRYLSGIITGNGAKSLAVGGWKDHVHIFFGMPVTICISDFMSIVKTAVNGSMSSDLLKENFDGKQAMELFLIRGVKEIK